MPFSWFWLSYSCYRTSMIGNLAFRVGVFFSLSVRGSTNVLSWKETIQIQKNDDYRQCKLSMNRDSGTTAKQKRELSDSEFESKSSFKCFACEFPLYLSVLQGLISTIILFVSAVPIQCFSFLPREILCVALGPARLSRVVRVLAS